MLRQNTNFQSFRLLQASVVYTTLNSKLCKIKGPQKSEKQFLMFSRGRGRAPHRNAYMMFFDKSIRDASFNSSVRRVSSNFAFRELLYSFLDGMFDGASLTYMLTKIIMIVII